MNYYEILEVSPNASPMVIRAAYKSLMQRYHPDKNPGNAAVAERASLVVQAYEVLSDAEKRAAYDLELKNRAPGHRPLPSRTRTAAASPSPREGNHFWLLCLITATAIGSGWAVLSLMKNEIASERERQAIPAAKAATPPPKTSPALEIPELVTDLVIKLKDPDRPQEDSGHVLTIPAVGVRIGKKDAEHALRHIENTADLIRQKLQDSLAEARFDELIKPEGERYLTGLILKTVAEATGMVENTGKSAEDPDSRDHYGVVEILLPEFFSVR